MKKTPQEDSKTPRSNKPIGATAWFLEVRTYMMHFKVNIFAAEIKGKIKKDDGTYDYMIGPDEAMQVFSGHNVFDDPEEARMEMIGRIHITPLVPPTAF